MKSNANKNTYENSEKTTFITTVVAIVAIIIITAIAVNSNSGNYVTSNNYDNSGLVSGIITTSEDVTSSLCKIVVNTNTVHDGSELITSLEVGAYVTYDVYRISIANINSNGCNVAIDGSDEYIAVGQIQKIGPVYVTVQEVLQ